MGRVSKLASTPDIISNSVLHGKACIRSTLDTGNTFFPSTISKRIIPSEFGPNERDRAIAGVGESENN